MSLFVFGHRNPDTDAICSAIAYADFLRQTGQPDALAACNVGKFVREKSAEHQTNAQNMYSRLLALLLQK